MVAGLVAWWRGISHMNHRGYIYIWANLFTVGLCLPLITAPAAWAGIMKMSFNAYRTYGADLTDFWEGFKENLGRGAVLALMNLVIVGVNVTNLWSYQGQSGFSVTLMRIIWLFALFIWFTVQLYMWPIFYQMEHPSLWGAMRNALIMAYLNPIFTVTLWLCIAPIVLLSTILMIPWMLLTIGALAAIANSAVINRLEAAGFTIERVEH